jgi:hypothetical protein
VSVEITLQSQDTNRHTLRSTEEHENASARWFDFTGWPLVLRVLHFLAHRQPRSARSHPIIALKCGNLPQELYPCFDITAELHFFCSSPCCPIMEVP